MTQKELIKKLQVAIGVTPDGDFGPITQAKSSYFDIDVIATEIPDQKIPEVIEPASGAYFGAPWIGANIDLLGRDETDPVLNARYVPEWKLEGLPGYKTLAGNTYAWCSVRANADRRKVGIKGTNSAAAASWSSWGKRCPFWFGAALDIEHRGGGRHISDFLYWIDEKKKVCATLDGNRGNKFCVARTDLSGSGDTLVSGPRWPSEWSDGQKVAMAEVLAAYPNLKVGGTSESTR